MLHLLGSNTTRSPPLPPHSFTADECLALALSLNCNEEALEQGVVTFEDFKRFALEKCGEKDSKKGRRTVSENNSLNGGNGMIDESEIAHGFYDDENDSQHDMYGVDGGKSALDLDTSIVSNIVKTNNAIVPPKSFLEEKVSDNMSMSVGRQQDDEKLTRITHNSLSSNTCARRPGNSAARTSGGDSTVLRTFASSVGTLSF